MTIPLRIAFDMDGTLADLSSAYAEVEQRLFGVADVEHEPVTPEVREVEQHSDDSKRPLRSRPHSEGLNDVQDPAPGHSNAIAYGRPSKRRQISG